MANFDLKVVLLGAQSSGECGIRYSVPVGRAGKRASYDANICSAHNVRPGKSCLLQTYVAKEWRSTLRPTYGAAFAARRYQLPNGHSVSIGAWDTSGSPAFQNVSKRFIQGADVAVAVCDLTSRPSWEKLKLWVSWLG